MWSFARNIIVVTAVVLTTASQCDKTKLGPATSVSSESTETGEIVVGLASVSPISYTEEEISEALAGYKYATIQFNVSGYKKGEDARLQRTFSNAIRRWLTPQHRAAALVLVVSLDGGKKIRVPIVTATRSETDGVKIVDAVNLGDLILPWFNVTGSNVIHVSYEVRVAKTGESIIADKLLDLTKTVTTLIGSQAAWVAGQLTKDHIEQAAEEIDERIEDAFLNEVVEESADMIITPLHGDFNHKGIGLALQGDELVPMMQIDITLSFRASHYTAKTKNTSAGAVTQIPDIPADPSLIRQTVKFSADPDTSVRNWLKSSTNSIWYDGWKTEANRERFVAGCDNILNQVRSSLGMNDWDATAAIWAELVRHTIFMNTRELQNSVKDDCFPGNLNENLKDLKFQIKSPGPRERKQTDEELKDALTELRIMLIPNLPNPKSIANKRLADEVEIVDHEGLLIGDSIPLSGKFNRTDAMRQLSRLNVERGGCYIAYRGFNGANYTMLVKSAKSDKLKSLTATFSWFDNPLPWAIKLELKSASQELLTAVQKVRLQSDGTVKPCGEETDPWSPWA